MASKTPNYNLNKIDLNDAPPDITVLNENFDTLDTKLKALNDTTDTLRSELLTLSVNVHLLDTDVEDLKALISSRTVDNAGAHNAIYRGKNLGDSVTNEQWAAIKAGTFEDMYIGDYWVIGNVTWRIAAFDYYLRKGNAPDNSHHVTIVPDENLYMDKIQGDGSYVDLSGGYVSTYMYTSGLMQAKTIINGVFGSEHIYVRRVCLTNAVEEGVPIGWIEVEATAELMNELNVFGNRNASSVPNPSNGVYSRDLDTDQYPLFVLDKSKIMPIGQYWLRDVSDTRSFVVIWHSHPLVRTASNANVGVRPSFSIKA